MKRVLSIECVRTGLQRRYRARAVVGFLLVCAAARTQPGVQGQWSAGYGHGNTNFGACPPPPNGGPNTQFEGIHLAVIPIDTPTNPNLKGWIFAMDEPLPSTNAVMQRYALINPATSPPTVINQCLSLPHANQQGGVLPALGDIFCSGHVWTRDGKLLFAGGTIYTAQGQIRGARLVYLWDPRLWNAAGNGWTPLLSLAQGRYYPTVTVGETRLDGDRYYITGGGDSTYPNLPSTYEVYKRSSVSPFAITPDADQNSNRIYSGPVQSVSPEIGTFYWYPRIHLLTTGEFFMAGFAMAGGRARHDPDLIQTQWDYGVGISGTPGQYLHFGSAILLPINLNVAAVTANRVMRLGGGVTNGPSQFPFANPTAVVETCSVNNGSSGVNVEWKTAASLTVPRYHCNAVQLPDGNVLVIGGERYIFPNYLPNLDAELLIGPSRVPTTPRPSQSPRTYHASAVLLPDARVFVSGGDTRTHDYEFYSPPYLFMGLRPAITGITGSSGYGQTIQIAYLYDDPEGTGSYVERVVLIRPGSITHHSDFEARSIELQQVSGAPPGSINCRIPPDGNTAPAGWYMVFLVTDTGVPSEASWVLVS